ncbi:ArsC family (seleno)protein [Schlesneria paludicola]|uniref:ArsC family (seleno)protein n=1 Tax=Schlesneria paludicola TaxID=360056 RepID=UPI0002D7B35C|nr:ArsC family (seleno)protein [Schlesneria paludicola]
MSKVDWSYHRKNCNSCSKATEFLTEHNVSVNTTVDARTVPLVESDAQALIDAANEIYVTRGTKVLHFDLKHERPAELLELIMGRSGKLRAPTLKVGKTLIVGFDQSTYERVLS